MAANNNNNSPAVPLPDITCDDCGAIAQIGSAKNPKNELNKGKRFFYCPNGCTFWRAVENDGWIFEQKKEKTVGEMSLKECRRRIEYYQKMEQELMERESAAAVSANNNNAGPSQSVENIKKQKTTTTTTKKK